MKKVIITGAGGFVGSALTSKMISEGVEVIAISRDFCPKFPRSRFVKKINSEIDDSEKILKLIPDDEYDTLMGYLETMRKEDSYYKHSAAAMVQKLIIDLPKNAEAAAKIV